MMIVRKFNKQYHNLKKAFCTIIKTFFFSYKFTKIKWELNGLFSSMNVKYTGCEL